MVPALPETCRASTRAWVIGAAQRRCGRLFFFAVVSNAHCVAARRRLAEPRPFALELHSTTLLRGRAGNFASQRARARGALRRGNAGGIIPGKNGRAIHRATPILETSASIMVSRT